MKLLTLDLIIRTYNEEDEIEGCLKAALKQKQDLNKIIVVDNNSTDKTNAIVKRLAQKNPQIVMLTETKQGAENARNKGFNSATADIIGMIDADTRIKSGWALEARKFLTENPELSGCSGRTIYYDVPFQKIADLASWATVFFANELIGGNYSFYGANMAIKQKDWQKIRKIVKGEESGQIMEDLSMSIAVDTIGKKIGWAKEMQADVSARRLRISPVRYVKYGARWWRTYSVYGRKLQAKMIRIFAVWPSNLAQVIISCTLRFHNPKTMKWSWSYFREGFEKRGFQ